MLIVLGGLAALPCEPYESAEIDGANPLAEVSLHHAADDRALHHGRGDHPHHRRAEELRHHLRDDAGRAREPRPRRSTSISTASPSPITTSATARRSRSCSSPSWSRSRSVMLHLRQRTKWTELGSASMNANCPRADRDSCFAALPSWCRRRCCSSSGCCRCRSSSRSTTAPIRRSSSRSVSPGRTIRACSRSNRSTVLPQQPHRHRHRDGAGAGDRRAGRLRHRADEGDARPRSWC